MCDFTLPNESILTDGTYVWSQLLSHYVGEHEARLPAPIVLDILQRSRDLDEAELDWDWWPDLLREAPAPA